MESLAERLLRAEGAPEDVELSIFLTDDETIRKLNAEYRSIDAPTDVLSFSQEPDESDPWGTVLGDVIISVPAAERQAEERGWPFEKEIEFLLIHGILHLLGYDDETEDGWASMMNKARIFLGIDENQEPV